MRLQVVLLFLVAASIGIHSCKNETGGPVVNAVITADSTAEPGDTVWLYSTSSTGNDSVSWSINLQPGHDTIADAYNDTAYLIPRVNGLYNIKLTVFRGADQHTAYHDLLVSGANVLYGTIDSDTTLEGVSTGTGPDYLVTGTIVVNARLSFDVQVVLEFQPHTGIIVTSSGSIVANNVTFRAAGDGWRGIQLLGPGNVFVSSTISGGGSESYTMDQEEKADLILSENAEASLSSNSFANSSGYGLVVGNSAKLVYDEATLTNAFVNNGFADNASGPMRIPAAVLEKMSSPELSGESSQSAIEIYASEFGSTLESDAVLTDYGLPYLFTGTVTFRRPLTIQKGCDLLFAKGAGLDIRSTLQVNGTASASVTCNGLSDQRASWAGIYVRSSDVIINHASFDNGGGTVLPGLDEKAALIIGGNLNMQNSEVSGSGGIGLWMKDRGAILYSGNFKDNTLSDNQTTNIRVGLDDVHKVISDNTLEPFSDETPVVEIRLGKSDFLDNWTDISQGIDYRVVDSVSIVRTKSLTIDPGVTIEFASGSAFNVSGSLNASGTASSPVKFIGNQATAGFWRGLFIQTDNMVVMDNVVISDGGGDATDKADVIVMPLAQSVSITNSSITNSAGYGVLIKAGAPDFGINDPGSNNTLSGTLGDLHDEN